MGPVGAHTKHKHLSQAQGVKATPKPAKPARTSRVKYPPLLFHYMTSDVQYNLLLPGQGVRRKTGDPLLYHCSGSALGSNGGHPPPRIAHHHDTPQMPLKTRPCHLSTVHGEWGVLSAPCSDVVVPVHAPMSQESVHYCLVPESDSSLLDEVIERKIERMQTVIDLARVIRAQQNIALKVQRRCWAGPRCSCMPASCKCMARASASQRRCTPSPCQMILQITNFVKDDETTPAFLPQRPACSLACATPPPNAQFTRIAHSADSSYWTCGITLLSVPTEASHTAVVLLTTDDVGNAAWQRAVGLRITECCPSPVVTATDYGPLPEGHCSHAKRAQCTRCNWACGRRLVLNDLPSDLLFQD